MMSETGDVRTVHLAGAGDMVTLLIDAELGLEDRDMAEDIKRFPLAKVETLFHIRHEDGSVQFFDKPLDPRIFGRVVVLTDRGPVPVETREPLQKMVAVRQEAKKKVFVQNAVRALGKVAPAGNIRLIHFVVMVGGSALDFEIPRLISDALHAYGVVTGRANVRSREGPRNAVATGLVLEYLDKKSGRRIMEGHGPEEPERPMVLIYAAQPVSEKDLAPILWGLEEEGIPGKIRGFSVTPVEALAEQAAEDSPLAVGIGINVMDGVAMLHHQDLRTHGPLFRLKDRKFETRELRRLGVNAARLVKRMPLVFNQEARKDTRGQNPEVISPEDFEALVSRIVTRILNP